MIEDENLRQMFKAECDERLQRLEQGLLQLEKDPTLKDCLEEVFREAHSLKGTARMLNVKSMEQLAHHFESVLKTAMNGDSVLETGVIERLYSGLDDLRALVAEAVTGENSGIELDEVLARLNNQQTESVQIETNNATFPDVEIILSPEPEPEKPPTEEPTKKIIKEKVVEAIAVKKPAPKKEAVTVETAKVEATENHSEVTQDYKIETIRVRTQQLDNLMTHVSELAVNKNRISQRLSDINDIISLWEEFKKQPADENQQSFVEELETRLVMLRNHVYEDNTRFEYLSNEIEEGISSIRLLPLSTVFNLFPRMVRDIGKQEGKQVELIIEGGDTVADKRIIEEIKDPLMHLIRNAIHHAIELPEQRQALGKAEQSTILLNAYQTASNIIIEVKDDGRGIDIEKIKRHALQQKLYRPEELAVMSERQLQALIFNHGFSTVDFVTDISGRGIGMAVVANTIERLKGYIEIKSEKNKGTLMQLKLPVTLATSKVLIIKLQNRFYALAVETVEVIRSVDSQQIFTIDGRQTILEKDTAVSISHLADLLELPNNTQGAVKEWMAVIITVDGRRLAILVDELVDEQEIVLKPVAGILKRVRNISGVTILGNGAVCIILNPHDLVKTAHGQKSLVQAKVEEIEEIPSNLILYAEDSITTRTQIKRILENEGFDVVAAVDGLDAYEKLGSRQFDAVVSDVTMPNMNGLELAEKIRSDKRYENLPIILVSAMDKPEDKHKGLEVGANAYISKGAFDQTDLLETLKRLI
ncbi:MAG: response regulator [Methylococcaceae bacterium]|nr:response regulator [Methylococcaceae bacterium]